MATVRWTEEAVRWLKDIHDYIAVDNPDAAQRTVEGVVNKARELRDFPLIGYRYPLRPDRHYRVLWYGHYRIVYLVRDQNVLDIVGVYQDRKSTRLNSSH